MRVEVMHFYMFDWCLVRRARSIVLRREFGTMAEAEEWAKANGFRLNEMGGARWVKRNEAGRIAWFAWPVKATRRR